MSRVALVTGACGFIGVHTCTRLLDEGWEVIGLDDLSRAGSERHLQDLSLHPAFTFVHADVSSADGVTSAFRITSPSLVIHLAAQVAVTTSVTDPRRDFEVNALGTLNILEACRQSSTRPFLIFASTNKVYGPLEGMEFHSGDGRYTLPRGWEGVDEKCPLDFYSPYGCSKGAADQYVLDFARIYQVPGVVLRQSCIYGPKQMGIEDQGWVAWFAIAALLGKPITIFGNGLQVRDLLHVSDLVDLYLTAWDRREDISGEAFNVGGGRANALGLLEYLEVLNGHGVEPKASFSLPRPGDQRVFVSDNRKVLARTGWAPRIDVVSGITEMLDDLTLRLARGDIDRR